MIRSPGTLSLWHRLAAVAVLSARSTTSSANHHRYFLASCFVSSAAFSSTARAMSPHDDDEDDKTTCRVVETHPFLKIHHFKQDHPIASTQDEARRLLHEHSPSRDGPYLAAIADRQTNGRGTLGRKWEYGVGNLYLTLCIPFDKIPVMPTLLPLYIAVVVAERAQQALRTCHADLRNSKVTVKWPNDVLINDQKLAGTLIESEIVDGTTWLLVGIGTNIQFAPSLDKSPGKHVRDATSIVQHCAAALKETEPQQQPSDSAYHFGADVAERLVDWMLQDTSRTDKATREAQVISQWKSLTEFGRTYELRGTIEDETAGKHQGEKVVLVDIQYDGQLIVRGQNGQNRLLIADYMF